MGQGANRPEPATMRTAVDESHAPQARAEDERRALLGTGPWEVLEFLRLCPAVRSEDAADDGRSALVLLAELRWQLLEHEQAQLQRLNKLPTHAQPTNTRLGALL